MGAFRRIESICDIRSAAFVLYKDRVDPAFNTIFDILDTDCMVLRGDDDAALSHLTGQQPDIIFIGTNGSEQGKGRFALCRSLRDCGWQGVMVLVTDDALDSGGMASITSAGFDNYLLASDSRGRVEDTIQWAILNRKRRNKYTIQFDDNPDSFYTLDKHGNVYDINRIAAEGSSYGPKDIVRRGIAIEDIGTLAFFGELIRPLIEMENVGRVFTHTVDEVERVYQVKTRVHNVPTIGLVATVVKTDITRTIYSRTMDILGNSITLLSERDNYTASHSSRVFYYSRHIAEELGCAGDKKFARALYFASLLHDIGKIGIKDEVLLKPGRLTKKEHDELATHPVKGCKMLKPYNFLRDSMSYVRSHHERPDGKGYPDGLRSGKISLGSSIIAVADCFDAMTSNRPYRKSLSFESAVSEIRQNLGGQFDSESGKAFLSMIRPGIVRAVKGASKKPLMSISQELIKTILQ